MARGARRGGRRGGRGGGRRKGRGGRMNNLASHERVQEDSEVMEESQDSAEDDDMSAVEDLFGEDGSDDDIEPSERHATYAAPQHGPGPFLNLHREPVPLEGLQADLNEFSIDVDFFKIRIGVENLHKIIGSASVMLAGVAPSLKEDEYRGLYIIANSPAVIAFEAETDRDALRLQAKVCEHIRKEHFTIFPSGLTNTFKKGVCMPMDVSRLARALEANNIKRVVVMMYGMKTRLSDFRTHIEPHIDKDWAGQAYDIGYFYNTPGEIILLNYVREKHKKLQGVHVTVSPLLSGLNDCGLPSKCGYMQINYNEEHRPLVDESAPSKGHIASIDVYSTISHAVKAVSTSTLGAPLSSTLKSLKDRADMLKLARLRIYTSFNTIFSSLALRTEVRIVGGPITNDAFRFLQLDLMAEFADHDIVCLRPTLFEYAWNLDRMLNMFHSVQHTNDKLPAMAYTKKLFAHVVSSLGLYSRYWNSFLASPVTIDDLDNLSDEQRDAAADQRRQRKWLSVDAEWRRVFNARPLPFDVGAVNMRQLIGHYGRSLYPSGSLRSTAEFDPDNNEGRHDDHQVRFVRKQREIDRRLLLESATMSNRIRLGGPNFIATLRDTTNTEYVHMWQRAGRRSRGEESPDRARSVRRRTQGRSQSPPPTAQAHAHGRGRDAQLVEPDETLQRIPAAGAFTGLSQRPQPTEPRVLSHPAVAAGTSAGPSRRSQAPRLASPTAEPGVQGQADTTARPGSPMESQERCEFFGEDDNNYSPPRGTDDEDQDDDEYRHSNAVALSRQGGSEQQPQQQQQQQQQHQQQHQQLLPTDPVCEVPQLIQLGKMWTWRLPGCQVATNDFSTRSAAVDDFNDARKDWSSRVRAAVMSGVVSLSEVKCVGPPTIHFRDGRYSWTTEPACGPMFNSRDEARSELTRRHGAGLQELVTVRDDLPASIRMIRKRYYVFVGRWKSTPFQSRRKAESQITSAKRACRRDLMQDLLGAGEGSSISSPALLAPTSSAFTSAHTSVSVSAPAARSVSARPRSRLSPAPQSASPSPSVSSAMSESSYELPPSPLPLSPSTPASRSRATSTRRSALSSSTATAAADSTPWRRVRARRSMRRADQAGSAADDHHDQLFDVLNTRPVTGLINTGNLCFAISVMQLLASSEAIHTWAQGVPVEVGVLTTIAAVAKVIRGLNQPPSAERTLRDEMSVIRQSFPQRWFSKRGRLQQQDADEFLYLTVLHRGEGAHRLRDEIDVQLGKEVLCLIGDQEDARLSQGSVEACLEIPVTSPSLVGCLQDMLQVEPAPSTFRCDHLPLHSNVRLRHCIAYTSDTLIIQLKRTRTDKDGLTQWKDHTAVVMSEVIDLSQFAHESADRQMFELKAVVLHMGENVFSGHYVAATRRNIEGVNRWFLIDDERVVGECETFEGINTLFAKVYSYELTRCVYLLLYDKLK